MSIPLEILDQVAERAKELKKLAQTPCYNHTQCGEDCLPDCPHYAEGKELKMLTIDRTPMMLKFERETGESATYLDYDDWLQMEVENKTQEYINWLENIAKSTELKECPNCRAEVIPNPYCHDLEQRIELLEMHLEEAQAKAAAYDILMSGGRKTLKEWANIFGLPFALGRYSQGIAFKCKSLPVVAGNNWWPTDVGDFGFAFIDRSLIDFNGDWTTSLTLPDGWREK